MERKAVMTLSSKRSHKKSCNTNLLKVLSFVYLWCIRSSILPCSSNFNDGLTISQKVPIISYYSFLHSFIFTIKNR